MQVILIGAGGFGREVLQYIRDAGTHRAVGFLDGNADATAGWADSPPVLGAPDTHDIRRDVEYIIAIGSPAVRAAIAARFEINGARFATVVHPRAYVAATAAIGVGCVIAPGAVVGPYAVMCDHAVLNVLASIGHDATVGRCTVFSPYAVINGAVIVGDEVLLGTRATVLPRVQVGQSAQLAAGAVVYRDVPAYALAQGDPAKARVMFAPPATDYDA